MVTVFTIKPRQIVVLEDTSDSYTANRFSHRIQVTQRAQYHEIAAKVKIVHRSNVGPTHIHNYTWGIGI
jgi:hypothetical protein